MFEAIGRIVVGLFASALAVLVLSIIHERILTFRGLYRFWIVRNRFHGELVEPFPWGRAFRQVASFRGGISGYWTAGAIKIPADPRRKLTREPFYGA